MLFSLLYFLVRRLLGAGGRLQDEKDIELLVLRHEVKVLQRTSGPTQAPGHRPGLVGGGEQGDDEEQLVLVRGEAGDPAPLASRTRPKEVDLSEDGSPRPAADRARSPGPHRPPRGGRTHAGVTSGSAASC
ncbi:MAG TPA: hypothetical protein VIM30_10510 [Candidatus Limnocylindrales bacterium]